MQQKIKKIVLFLLITISVNFNVTSQVVTETLTLPGSQTWDPLGWLKMIDEVGQMYDLITYNITQIENQYEQIANAVEAAKGINWDDLEISGFDVRKDIKDAGKKLNKLVTQARKIQETLEKPSINCGSSSYSIKDLVGGNGYDRNIFAAMNTMKTYMTENMKNAIDGMVNGLSENEKKAITQKYGLSPRNYLFIQQSMAQIKSATGEAIAKASADAIDLVRAAKVTETNKILKAAYASVDKEGNITDGASREAILLMSEQVVDNLISLEEALNEINRMNALKLVQEEAEAEAKAAHEAEVRAAKNAINSMTGNMFKKTPGNEKNSWVDIPVIETIDYFSKMLAKILTYLRSLATLFGVIGLLWTAFKLINSRITVKDMFWDTLYKWLLFIFLANCYVPLCSGVLWLSNYFGSNLGIGKEEIVDNLVKIKTETEKVTNSYTEFIDGKIDELKQKYPKNNFISYAEYVDKVGIDSVNTAADFMTLTIDDLGHGFDNSINLNGLSRSGKKNAKYVHKLEISSSDLQELWDSADQYFEQLDSQNLYSTKLLETLDRILIVKTTDGKTADNLTESYFDIDLYLKDSQGNDTVYLAPSSLLRLGTFVSQLFWEQCHFDHATISDDDEKPSFIERSVDSFGNTILTLICCICIILSICFVLLQYIMCIIEFIIICSLGAFFIPMILFDGTKELPKKLIPTITGFFIKMLVMNICTFFVFYLYLHFTSDVLCDGSGMNWVTVATVIFNCLLGFVLTSNAPKVSQTLLTGQPQLSMGEAVAAGATALGAARVGSKAAKGAVHTAGGAVRGTVNGGTNVLGSGVKAAAAASSEMKNWSGGGKFFGAVKGAAGSVGRDIGEGIKSKGEDFLHGGGKGGAGGGAGSAGGGKLHGQSGTLGKVNRDNAGQSISNVSNPKFQNATIYDKDLETNRNMSYKEFFHEKWNQGINSVAQNESKAAENQPTKNLKDAGIGNNLANRKNENTI